MAMRLLGPGDPSTPLPQYEGGGVRRTRRHISQSEFHGKRIIVTDSVAHVRATRKPQVDDCRQ